MTAKIIDGKAIAEKLRSKLRTKVQKITKQDQPRPCLAVILVGDDFASTVYVRNKLQACQEVGIESKSYKLSRSTSQKTLISLIQALNKNKRVHGILLQLPLPKHIQTDEVLEHIHPLKDVDGFHSLNMGRLAQFRPQLQPCTPYGVMRLLGHIKQKFPGKEAVIVGASNIVGKPMALELLAQGCTVTICHRLSQNLQQHIARADILVSAVGKPGFIKGSWIKKGATVIDVGITRLPNGKLSGDIDFNAAIKRAKWITPVPGGVGPMTVAILLENTVKAQGLQGKEIAT